VELSGWPTLVAGVVGPHEVFHALVLAGLSLFWLDIRGIAKVEERVGAAELARAA